MADHGVLEKGNGNVVDRDPLAKEVYGIDVTDSREGSGELVIPSKAATWGRKVRAWINKIGAEERGIERVTEEQRTNQHPFSLFTLWSSANICTATLAFGTIGPALFGLGWWDSFLCILFFNFIGAIPPALMATLGPKLGLRTMTVQRFSFGWWPAKLMAILNAIICIGWAMVNTIAGANILYDVGDGHLPQAVAVLILALLALIISIFGHDLVHTYERYSWIVMLICFCIVAGFGAKHFVNIPMGSGAAETSGVLSFGTTIISFQISWSTIAADYAVYIRETTKPWKIFVWTWAGFFFSQFLIEALGAALMTSIHGSPAFTAAYDARGVGGLTGQIFEGYGTGVRGFGKFIEVILSFSVVAVVITNIYSLGLNIQIISNYLLVVPRLIWTTIAGIIFLVAAIAGRNHLQEVMEDFLNVIAYWLTPFLAIMFLEHFCFRRGYAYDVTAWDKPKKLPYGIAAFIVFCIGTVIGILCMSQVWWVGPIALAVGNAPYGTDISWELALGVTIVLYVPARWYERRITGF